MKVRDKMEKSKSMDEVCITCRYFALDNDELLKFYVDTSAARGQDLIASLKSYFNVLPEIKKQALCLGHAGCGKSTMFYQLEKNLEETYYVIRFSVQELLDLKNITFADLLCALYQKIFQHCHERIQNSEKLKQAYDTWNSTITTSNDIQNSAEISVSSEAGLGFSGMFLKLLTKLTTSLKTVETDRIHIQTEMKRHIRSYVDLLNELIVECNEVLERPILMMIEDLEKILTIESINDIFVQNVEHFHSIKLNLLLTAPISLKYSSDYRVITQPYFSREDIYPMIAISDPIKDTDGDGNIIYKYTENRIGRNTLKEIVYARISNDLIDDAALENAVSYSGGVIRDLLWMIFIAAGKCIETKKDKIEISDIENAFVNLQDRFHDVLRTSYISVIEDVHKNPYGIIDDSKSVQFFELLKNEAIIEYNGKQWKGVHPAVIECLRNSGELI